jgi:hypothetical protein
LGLEVESNMLLVWAGVESNMLLVWAGVESNMLLVWAGVTQANTVPADRTAVADSAAVAEADTTASQQVFERTSFNQTGPNTF